MRRAFAIIILCFVLPFQSSAIGAKIYTKKAKLEDFTASTLRVVATGKTDFDTALSDEISTRWNLSPYEFISPGIYKGCGNSNSYYFLLVESRDGVDFLSLRKGGKEKDENSFKRPFEVVSIPISSTGGSYRQAIIYLPAYIDIIQRYVRGAINSDSQAYAGLAKSNISNLNGKEACLDDNQSEIWFKKEEPNTLIGVIISPLNPQKGQAFYRMLISTDTHELFYFRTQKLKEGEKPEWSRMDRIRIYGRAE